jgi:hypothetical protein
MAYPDRLLVVALASLAFASAFLLLTPFRSTANSLEENEILRQVDPYTSRFFAKGEIPKGSSPTVLIVINTIEKYYTTRLMEIRRTWVKRVLEKNSMEIIFMGSTDNKGIPDVFASNCRVAYDEDSCKKSDAITLAYKFITQPYGQKYDWIFLGDDDLYIFPDNLQRVIMLLQENAVNELRAWGIPRCGGDGCRGFCGGGGYLMNRKTLSALVEGVDHSEFHSLRDEIKLFDEKCGRCGDLAISRIMEDRRGISLESYPKSGDYVWNFDNGDEGLIASLNGTSDRIPWLYHYPAKGRMDFVHQKGIEFNSNKPLDD